MRGKDYNSLMDVKNLSKEFVISKRTGEVNKVLNDIDLKINEGDFIILFGPSGCGKTTFINCLIGLEPATEGRISVKGHEITKWNEDKKASFRAQEFGVMYQMPYWLKSLEVVENVALPLMVTGGSKKESLKEAEDMLKEVGLEKRSNYNPAELSGGEQQRVGLARALIGQTDIIIADEPTGNLDIRAGKKLMNMLKELNERHNNTVILVTHNLDYLPYASRKIGMEDGKIVADSAAGGEKIVKKLEKKIRVLQEEEEKEIDGKKKDVKKEKKEKKEENNNND